MLKPLLYLVSHGVINYQTLCLCNNSGLGFDHLRYHAQTHPINADNTLSLARNELSFRTGGD